jgi:hypothetical protein
LFITAAATLVEHATRGHAEWLKVEKILRRAVDQAASIRGEVL